MDLNKMTPFRLWVQSIWFENKEEHLTFKEEPFTIKQYWDQHKYWLKRQYKSQRDKNDHRRTTTETV